MSESLIQKINSSLGIVVIITGFLATLFTGGFYIKEQSAQIVVNRDNMVSVSKTLVVVEKSLRILVTESDQRMTKIANERVIYHNVEYARYILRVTMVTRNVPLGLLSSEAVKNGEGTILSAIHLLCVNNSDYLKLHYGVKDTDKACMLILH